MKPFLKYVGGKSRLLPELLPRVPKTFNRYFEPFVGGGALFFALAPDAAVLGDMNSALINTYRAVAEDVRGVIACLEHHKKRNVNGHYYEVRTWWNDESALCTDRISVAAAFIYLNKTCFNGLWRVNKKGAFNVPKGDYKDPQIFDVEVLEEASKRLGAATLMLNEFDVTTADATAGDFVYADSPYDPIDKTSNFTSYTHQGFGDAEQRRLALHAKTLRDRGVYVMLSNNDTPYIRELYKGFQVETVRCGRSINSKATKRGAVNELIIRGY